MCGRWAWQSRNRPDRAVRADAGGTPNAGACPDAPLKRGFAPVADARTRLLICGNLPGDASLVAGRYYAHPRNRFWHLLGAAADMPELPALPYDDRLRALLSRGIGLWDVAASGSRRGSLDTALRNVEPTDLAGLAATLPALRAIAFNGSAAARIGRRLMAGDGRVALVDLPSSSPAYCAITPHDKQMRWMVLKQWLER